MQRRTSSHQFTKKQSAHPIPKQINLTELITNTSTALDHVKIFITTWNMGNAEPKGMETIFGDNRDEIDSFDIFVIGLQESTYTFSKETNKSKDTGKSTKESSRSDCIAQLREEVKDIFGENYYEVSHCYRAQLQLYVIAKVALQHRISNIEQSIENTGFLHVFPNKGGLLVTFSIDGTKLAFVSCHLTAHEGVKHCAERNMSIVEILGGVRAGDKRIDITEQFHHVFWMGDMNYRLTFDYQNTPANTKKNIKDLKSSVSAINVFDMKQFNDVFDANLEDSDSDDNNNVDMMSNTHGNHKKTERYMNMKKLHAMIAAEQWALMLELDELNREIRAGRILNNFVALQPRFPPTFKRIRGMSIPMLTIPQAAGPVPVPVPITEGTMMTMNGVSMNSEEDSLRPVSLKQMHSLNKGLIHVPNGNNNNNNTSNISNSSSSTVSMIPTISLPFPLLSAPSIGLGGTPLVATTSSSKKYIIRRVSSHQIDQDEVNGVITIGYSPPSSPLPAPILSHNQHNPHATPTSLEAQATATTTVSDYYHRKRLPSFTDRILYKSMRTFRSSLRPEFFDSCETALSSDHKPVKAGFDLTLAKGKDDIYVNRDILSRQKNIRAGHKLRLMINELRGENLEEMDSIMFGGGSDPYIVVTTDPPTLLLKKERITRYFAGVKSSVIKHNLNPVWTESLHVVLASIDLEGLARNATLIFQVWDEDLTNAHDLIGVMTIPLRDILIAVLDGRPYVFEEMLRSNSEIMGKLMGKISLEGDLHDYESACLQLAAERGKSNQYIPLGIAEIEQANLRAAEIAQCACVLT